MFGLGVIFLLWKNNSNHNKISNSNTLTSLPMPSLVTVTVRQKLSKNNISFQQTWTPMPSLETVRQKVPDDGIPDQEKLKEFDVHLLQAVYKNYMSKIQILCRRQFRMGNLADGGWEICDDIEYRPIHPCVIYSFGYGNKIFIKTIFSIFHVIFVWNLSTIMLWIFLTHPWNFQWSIKAALYGNCKQPLFIRVCTHSINFPKPCLYFSIFFIEKKIQCLHWQV